MIIAIKLKLSSGTVLTASVCSNTYETHKGVKVNEKITATPEGEGYHSIFVNT